jgi:hypothetical protein
MMWERSPMIRKSLDLVVVSTLALAALTLTLLGASSAMLRLLLGLPLVLVLPGYAVTAAIFPGRSLGGADRALFTMAMSLSTVILCGFVLNRAPWGLRPEAWAVMLSDVTLGGGLIAFARRQLNPARSGTGAPGEPPATGTSVPAARQRMGLSGGQSLLFGLAIAVLAGAMLLARGEAALRPDPNVLQLWMLPGDQAAPHTLRVGVNSIGLAGTYRLEIQRGGYTIHAWPALIITPGQTWQAQLALDGQQPGSGPFEARLYRSEEPNVVYRRVALWLDAPKADLAPSALR